ncbi:glycosyl hydrolase 2 galactose-binding domain-containing protein [Fodinicola feengrottensis]|uniref:glycosyl hydrolase 2 galactose-binding domain-containing protein n=1 Tax=Fodinicola feengrottensis TaxID=435914 RepID=UPI0013D43B87|nr:sugar-binding domain-containing protein [Fodinicola feengrottensis]
MAVLASVLLAAGMLPATAWAGPADTLHGTAQGTTDLTKGWAVQTSAVATATGDKISDPGYSTAGWLPISRPETEMAALLENGRYPNVFYSNNLASVPTAQFTVNWWYRNQLTVHPRPGQHTYLIMNGISGRANLWLNGTKLADEAQLQGAYSRIEYDITSYVHDGANAIALDIYKNDANKYLTSNTVDWNPKAPDGQTGLQFAPQLAQDGAISLRDTHVLQNNAKDLSTSDLTVKADLRNNTTTDQSATFAGCISRGATRIPFSKTVTVPAGKTVTVSVSRQDAPGLHVVHPAIWWPAQMGDQPLYHLSATAVVQGQRSDAYTDDFGIRTVTSYLTKVVPGRPPAAVRLAAVRHQRRAAGDPWRRLVARHVSALLLEKHRRPARVHPQPWAEHPAVRGKLPAGRHVPADGPRRHPGADWLAVLQSLGGSFQDLGREHEGQRGQPSVERGRGTAGPPQRFHVLPGQRQRAGPGEGVDLPDRLHRRRLADPAGFLGGVQILRAAGKLRFQGRPVQLRAAELLVGHRLQTAPTNDDTFTNAGSAYGLDTETSAGNTIPTTSSLNRFLPTADQNKIWGTSARPPAAGADRTSITSIRTTTTQRPAGSASTTPRSTTGTVHGPTSPRTRKKRRSASTRSLGPSSRHISDIPRMPRTRAPGSFTG